MSSTDIQLIHDIEQNEFRIEVAPGEWAKVSYRKHGHVLFIDHTSVPSSLRGQGKGAVMMETVLPEIEKLGYTIVAECSYVKHYLAKHSAWQHLVVNG